MIADERNDSVLDKRRDVGFATGARRERGNWRGNAGAIVTAIAEAEADDNMCPDKSVSFSFLPLSSLLYQFNCIQ